MPKVFLVLLCTLITVSRVSQAQTHDIMAGIRAQKSINLYLECGASVYYRSDNILNQRVSFGLHYVSSRLGSAINSNAIKQDRVFISSHYVFRSQKKLSLLTGTNLGYFHAYYPGEEFKNLQNKSLLLSIEFGPRYTITKKISMETTLGYNLITGNGIDGPGTLYPLYFQISILWDFIN